MEVEKEIDKIKEKWIREITSKFEQWDEEEKKVKKENPNVPLILDKHLKEQVAIEQKYMKLIKEIENSKK